MEKMETGLLTSKPMIISRIVLGNTTRELGVSRIQIIGRLKMNGRH